MKLSELEINLRSAQFALKVAGDYEWDVALPKLLEIAKAGLVCYNANHRHSSDSERYRAIMDFLETLEGVEA